VQRDAYYHPNVDSSDEPFKWGLPDLDALRGYVITLEHLTVETHFSTPVFSEKSWAGAKAKSTTFSCP
jgi:hypothetical protein